MPSSADFWPGFARAAKLIRNEWDTSLRKLGARAGQQMLLHALWEEDGLTPKQVATIVHVAVPTIVKMGARMEAEGFLKRKRDPDDRRLVHLFLTEKGRSAKKPVEEARRLLYQRAGAGLTEEERRHLAIAFDKIVRNLSQR